MKSSDDTLWAILVHEACAANEPIAGTFRTGGWPMGIYEPHQEEHHAIYHASPDRQNNAQHM